MGKKKYAVATDAFNFKNAQRSCRDVRGAKVPSNAHVCGNNGYEDSLAP